MTPKPKVPQFQVRALQDDTTITVYQAYNATIATAAVETQYLASSPSFSFARMTWIKPSWTWMMYRSGYSHKDANQARILALKMKRENFIELLSHARLAKNASARTTGTEVVVQWDPERSVRIGRLDHRSIQIGISNKINERWVKEWVEGIEDVTDQARRLKERLDEDGTVEREKLIEEGLVPVETVFELPEKIQRTLGMLDTTTSETEAY